MSGCVEHATCITLSPNSICCVTSRHETHNMSCTYVRVAPCLFQHGGRRKSSSARVYKFSYLCSGFAYFSGTTSGKSEVDMSTPVHAVTTPLEMCRASRACSDCRDERVSPWCPTSATQHVTILFLYQNAWARQRVVSCSNVTQQVEFGLYALTLTLSALRWLKITD